MPSATTITPDMIYEQKSSLAMSDTQQQVLVGGTPYILGINHWSLTESSALIHALVASFSVILVSELGDKTFIITAIMAMKNSRLLVFLASAFALLLMTVLSVGMGVAVTVIPKIYTHYASIVLFICFGFKMLKEAHDLKEEAEESEFEEVKRSLEQKNSNDASYEKNDPTNVGDRCETILKADTDFCGGAPSKESKLETDPKPKLSLLSRVGANLYVAPIIIEVFTMIFVAEWGDRSQISTVILAAREDVVGVFIGSFAGHILCTGLAVIGGRFVAEMISVRTMTLLGGLIFLFFAVFALISGPE